MLKKCYENFYMARKWAKVDVEYLSLHLAFYLASWGMYRGSSFLIEKDYKVHIPVVGEILKAEYDILCNVTCDELQDKNTREQLDKLTDFIREYYYNVREDVKGAGVKEPISATLITKILMGTLGCVPAYDKYFVKGLKSIGNIKAAYNMNSVKELAQFYKDNLELLEEKRKELKVGDIIYPQMKLLDMGFWQIGKSAEEKQ